MFGIDDPLIIAPYVLMILCVVFSVWYGIHYWNKDDNEDGKKPNSKNKK